MSITLKFSRFRIKRSSMIPVPISPQTRIASITANKIETGQLRRLNQEQWPEIERFQPQILIGCAADLERLAILSEAGSIDTSSVDTAVLVTTAWNAHALTDVQRVVLWQAFAVPVYELLVSSHGYLIASECEAHAGWHLEPGVGFAPSSSGITLQVKHARERLGTSARIETAVCACARKAPRMVAEKPHLVRVLAATA